jgi:hypothetical protein
MHDINARLPPPFEDVHDLICLAHHRWPSVAQRPQHLMVRFARRRRVFFVEPPRIEDVPETRVTIEMHDGVTVVVPHLPEAFGEIERVAAQRAILDGLIAYEGVERYALWYYTPQALRFSSHLFPDAVAYDCLGDVPAARASPELPALERELMARADVVFTAGRALYEARRSQHPNLHAIPSSADVAHFATALWATDDPEDQRDLARPRLGFFGPLDERVDTFLLDGLAAARPDWPIVVLGSVATIQAGELPDRPNIHYLGAKSYAELPSYLAGWDVALLPFARNTATRFGSPTAMAECLAAGRPVVSTSIRDVVQPYGERGLVYVADTVADMVRACCVAMREPTLPRRARAEAFLRGTSWDHTWARMSALLDAATGVGASEAPVAVRAAGRA